MSARARRGTAIIIAIVCLVLVSAISVTLVKVATLAHAQTDREPWRIQSAWLAESALGRGAARLTSDETYRGETWSVDNVDRHGHRGTARITVAADPDDPSRQVITVTADFPDFPDDPTERVRTTRTLTVENPVK